MGTSWGASEVNTGDGVVGSSCATGVAGVTGGAGAGADVVDGAGCTGTGADADVVDGAGCTGTGADADVVDGAGCTGTGAGDLDAAAEDLEY